MEIKIDEKDILKTVSKNLLSSSMMEDIIVDVLEEDNIKESIKDTIRTFFFSPDGKEQICILVKNYLENDFDITNESDIMDLISESIKKMVITKFNL